MIEFNKSGRSIKCGKIIETNNTMEFNETGNIIKCNQIIENPYIYSSKSISYSESASKEYLTRAGNVGWSDSEVAGNKGNIWTPGNKVTMCIITSNNKCFFSDNTVASKTALKPISGTLREATDFTKLIIHGENYNHSTSLSGYININGKQSNTQGRGQTLWAINKETMTVASSIYKDTYGTPSLYNDLGNWARARLNEGYVVVGSSYDASSMGGELYNLLVNEYHCLGVWTYDTLRVSMLFVLQKGLSGTENYYQATSESVAVDLTIPFFKGTGLIPPKDIIIGSNRNVYCNEFIES